MNPWLENILIARQTLESAESRDAIRDALQDIVRWLLGDSTQFDLLLEPSLEENDPLIQEAVNTLLPCQAQNDCVLVIPLVAEEALQGVVRISAVVPIDEAKISVVYLLSHLAALSLARLSWPTSPQIFRQLVENANVAMDVAGLDGTIVYTNLAAAQLYGAGAPEELMGQNVSSLYYGDEEARVARDLISHSRTQDGWIGDVTQQYIDGKPLPVRLAVFALRDHQGHMTGYGAIIQNLTEQQQLVYSLQRQARRLRAAAEIARATISKLDLESLLTQVGTLAQSLFGFDMISIYLIESKHLVRMVTCTNDGPQHLDKLWLPLDYTSLNGSACLDSRSMLVNDVSKEPRYYLDTDLSWLASELVVPIRLDDRVIGTLDVGNRQPNSFAYEDIDSLEGIAIQLAGAIENARLFATERTQIRQQAALNAISQMLVAAYNLDELWGKIYEQIAGLFNVMTFYVMRYDAPTNLLNFVYLVIDGAETPLEAPSPLRGLSGLLIQSGQPLLLRDLPAQLDWIRDQGYEPLPIWGETRGARSWLGVPLRARDGAIIGLISVQSRETNVFTEREQQLLTAIATQVSLAMENVRLFNQLSDAANQLKARARRLEALYQFGTLLSTSLERNRILPLAAEQIVNLMHADHCALLLADERNMIAQVVAEHPPTALARLKIPIVNADFLDTDAETTELITADVTKEPRLAGILPMLNRVNIQSVLLIRVLSKGKVIGAVSVHAIGKQRAFTEEDVDLGRTIATQVALAIDNADLYEKALVANELKSQFLATMSHELRTPLNAILGYTEMIISGVYGDLSDKQKDRLQRVFSNARHLLELINDVLDLAKIESGRMTLTMEQLNINEIITNALGNIAPQAEAKKLALGTELRSGLPDIVGDRVRIRQIVVNLLGNAVKFTRDGSIRVETALLSKAASPGSTPLHVPDYVNLGSGQWVAILVRDTGIGIAKENFEMIFDAFRQVDGSPIREYPGTGLGLSITRQLIEMHGGKIWVESEVGRGSTFSVILPALRLSDDTVEIKVEEDGQ